MTITTHSLLISEILTLKLIIRGGYYYVEEGIDSESTSFMAGYEDYNIETISIEDAQYGDIILKETNGTESDGPAHTAIFLSYENGVVEYISGNSSNAVRISTCSPSALHAICKPNYTKEHVDSWTLNEDSGSTVTLDNTGMELTNALIYAAAFDNYGKMTGIAIAAIDGYSLTFADELNKGSKLFFLNSATNAPLCESITLQ